MSRCGWASGSRPTGASSFSLMPSSSRLCRRPAAAATSGVEVDAVGQQAELGSLRAAPGRAHPLDQVLDAVAERVGVGVAVDARQRGEEVQLARHQAAAGAAGRDQRRDPAVDLGVERVAEPQLEPGAERVAHGRAEVGPAAARHEQVEAEREAAAGQLLQVQLEVVEVGAQRAPAVDDEVDVAVAVVDPALALRRGAVGLDRVDALRPEVRLAAVDDAGHLGDDPAYDVGLASGCRRRRRGGARPSARRRRRRSPSRRTATPAASSSAPCW